MKRVLGGLLNAAVARKMLASTLMFVLASSLAIPAFARPDAKGRGDQAGDATRLREQVTHLRAGAWIEVRLVNREKVHGRLGAIEPDGFALKLRDPSAPERRIAFADVKSIKAIQGPRSRVAAWVVAGVLVGVLVVALAILLKERHNERG
jgi:hypothetical protein